MTLEGLPSINPFSCNYTIISNVSGNFTGTWDGAASGTMSWQYTSITETGTFTANPPRPAFPISVSSNITTTTANATAQIQPRPQDVGISASVFVFAHAPSNLVIGSTPAKRAPVTPPVPADPNDAIVCVLAQVNASGQLVAVSASNMKALLTAVLSSQLQAVQILNNVPTQNLAGASLFVGYGSNAASMLANGVYQSALSIPGTVQCTADLASAPAPQTPGELSGLWWNESESGWGIFLTERGSAVFAAWYTYDAAGHPKWYVAPDCGLGAIAVTSSCTSVLYEVNGPTFFGANFNSHLEHVLPVGDLRITFQSANKASMSYTVGAQTRTVAITRQSVGVGTTPPVVDYSDMWWNPNESGWGIAMAHQFGNIFLAWYVYDGTGKPVWYVASNCVVSGSSCSGPLYRTLGPAFGPTFDPRQIQVISVGSAIVSFIDANNAVLSYTVDGVNATKTITRELF